MKNFIRIVFGLIVFGFNMGAIASPQCSLVFSNAVSNLSGGTIYIDGTLTSTGDRVLDTTNLSGNNLNSRCDGLECYKSNMNVEALELNSSGSYTNFPDLAHQNDTDLYLTDGTHYFSNFQLNGGKTVHLTGSSTTIIYINGNITLDGKFDNTESSKLVIIYLGTNNFAVQTSSPLNAFIYAPNANIHVNRTVKGAIVSGKEIRINGGGNVEYDSNALLNLNVNECANITPPEIKISEMRIDENTTKVIKGTELNTTDKEQKPEELVYHLNSLPIHGNLYKNGVLLDTNSTFTQKDINDGNISYKHDGSETTSDSFNFGVTDGTLSSSPLGTMQIYVNPINDAPVITPVNLFVNVNESAKIINLNLPATDAEEYPAQLVYTITTLPTNGTIKLNGVNLGVGGTFTQSDIDYGRVTFVSNGTISLSRLYFNLTDGFNIVSSSLGIKINSLPQIINKSITVNQNERKIVTNSNLKATDNEENTSQLVYTITALPTKGVIYYSGVAITSTSQNFTQKDIDDGKIEYLHTYGDDSNDSFNFNVSDGYGSVNDIMIITINKATSNLQTGYEDFRLVYNSNLYGNIKLIGNVVLCEKSGGNCVPNSTKANNDVRTYYVDVDNNSSTFNSSSADLVLRPDAKIKYALLSWQGRTENISECIRTETQCTRYWSNGTCRTWSNICVEERTNINRLKLKTPLSPNYTEIDALDGGKCFYNGESYQCYKNITNLIKDSGTYTVADLYVDEGQTNYYGAWALTVAYEDLQDSYKNLSLFTGYKNVQDSTGYRRVDINISGFLTPASGNVNSELFVFAGEGDLPYRDDKFQLTDKIGNFQNVDASNINNVFNSSINNGTPRNPTLNNNMGIDIDVFSVGTTGSNIISNSQTSTTIRLETSGDQYYPGMVAFATELYSPKVCYLETIYKNDLIVDENTSIFLGDRLVFEVNVSNIGTEEASKVQIDKIFDAPLGYNKTNGTYLNGVQKTNAVGDDEVDYVDSEYKLKVRVGTGANATNGGQIAVNGKAEYKYNSDIISYPQNGEINNTYMVNYVSDTLKMNFNNVVPKCVDNAFINTTIYVSKFSVEANVTPKNSNGDVSVGYNKTINYTVKLTNKAPFNEDNPKISVSLLDGFVFTGLVTANGWDCPPPPPYTISNNLECQLNGTINKDGNFSEFSFTIKSPNSDRDFYSQVEAKSSLDTKTLGKSNPQRIIVGEGLEADVMLSLKMEDSNGVGIGDNGVIPIDTEFSLIVDISKLSSHTLTNSKLLVDLNETNIESIKYSIDGGSTYINIAPEDIADGNITIPLGDISVDTTTIKIDVKGKEIGSNITNYVKLTSDVSFIPSAKKDDFKTINIGLMAKPKPFDTIFSKNLQGDYKVFSGTSGIISISNIPTNAKIEYARLYWYGYLSNYRDDILYKTADSITFKSNSVTYPNTNIVIDSNNLAYQGSLDVTNEINSSGDYSISGIEYSSGFAGWILVVAYEDNSTIKKIRNVAIQDGFVGIANRSEKNETNGIFERNSTKNFNLKDANTTIFGYGGNSGGDDKMLVDTQSYLNKFEEASDNKIVLNFTLLNEIDFSVDNSDKYFVGVVATSALKEPLLFTTNLKDRDGNDITTDNPAEVGETITVSVTIKNQHDYDLTNINIVDILLDEDKFELVNSDNVPNSLSLNKYGEETFTYTIRAKSEDTTDFKATYQTDFSENVIGGNSFEGIEIESGDDIKLVPPTLTDFDILNPLRSGEHNNSITTKTAGEAFDLTITAVNPETIGDKNYQVRVKIVDVTNGNTVVVPFSSWEVINKDHTSYTFTIPAINESYKHLQPILEWRLISEEDALINKQDAEVIDDKKGEENLDSFAIKPYSLTMLFLRSSYIAGLTHSELQFSASDNGYIQGDTNLTIIYNKYMPNKIDIDNSLNGNFVKGSPFTINGTAVTLVDFNYSDIGYIDLNLTDKKWTEIDQPNDCVSNSCSNAKDSEGKVGCDICANSNMVKFTPKQFEVTFINQPYLDNNFSDANFTYYSNDLNMSALVRNLSLKIKAINHLNEITKNYSNGLYEENITLSNIFNIPDNPIHVDDNLSFNNEDLSFIDGETTLNLNDYRFNYSRAYNTLLEPRFINGTQVDINFTIKDNSLVEGNVTTNPDKNATFYYGRVKGKDVTIYDKSVDAKIYSEIYCKTCNKVEMGISGFSVSPNDIGWYINSKDSVSEVKAINLKPNENMSGTSLAPIPFNNGDITRNFSYSGTNEKHKEIVHLSIPEYLYYTKFGGAYIEFATSQSPLNHPTFSLEFISSLTNDWGGSGKTVDDTVKVKKQDVNSSIRMQW